MCTFGMARVRAQPALQRPPISVPLLSAPLAPIHPTPTPLHCSHCLTPATAHYPQKLVGTLTNQASRFWALSGKFMPMVGLFFMLAFVNTILDSLKDTLVITAAGGGAQVGGGTLGGRDWEGGTGREGDGSMWPSED